MQNVFKPYLAGIIDVVDETIDTKTFRLEFVDEKVKNEFTFKAGQFGEYSVFGEGEATFCISSSPTQKGFIECSLKKTGKVTKALHDCGIGDIIGFRGPYGNSFPIEQMYGKNLLFIGGGIGLAPLRSLIVNCMDERSKFNGIKIIYGARSVGDLVYKKQLQEWKGIKDIELILTVDPGGQTPDWKEKVGFVPTVFKEVAPPSKDTVLITCGPPIMIRFTIATAVELGFTDEQIITTLEMKMKCGIGKCGRCNIGKTYVCKDGPVFTYTQLKQLPPEF